METRHTLLPIAFVAAFVGATLRRPVLADAQSEPTQRPGAAASASRADDPNNDDLDTLDLIGQSLSVNVSTEALRRRAARWSDALAAPSTTSDLTWERALDFTTALLGLPLRDDRHDLDTTRTAAKQLSACRPDPPVEGGRYVYSPTCQASVDLVRSFVARYLNRDALAIENADPASRLLAQDFDAVDKTALKLAILHRAAADQDTEVRFLVATLPDPVDSYTGWQFDPMLDAIAQALTASDYLLDRFHLPDSDAEDSPDGTHAAPHRQHEIEPGAIIYRRHLSSPAHGGAPKAERLVLLLAFENPAGGVHTQVLTRAIRLVTRWQGLTPITVGRRPDIPILGPTFSGSSDSIKRTIGRLGRTIVDARSRLRFISGSATDPLNQATIESSLPGWVTFQATVQPDDVLVPALLQHLTRLHWSLPIAVLFEGNTQYGREVWKIFDSHRSLLEHGSLLRRAAFPGQPSLIQLPFPMNVSRLRTTTQPDAAAAAASRIGLPSRFRPLAMEELGNPVDKIPLMHPNTSGTYAELGVSRILDTLRQERVRTVALLATDPRDKLFLAQEIAQAALDISIVTVESEALYAHPDYARYLQGALVASTYPLYSGNQRRQAGATDAAQRRQFASGAAQGIYNAAIALLNYDENGQPLESVRALGVPLPKLIEYGLPDQPCAKGCRPPVWVSVIGRNEAWPLRVDVPGVPSTPMWDFTGGRPYVFPIAPEGTDATARPTILAPPHFMATLGLLVLLVASLWSVARRTWSAPAGEAATMTGDSLQPRPTSRTSVQVACVLSLLLIEVFVGAICLLWIAVQPSLFSIGATLAIAASVVCLGDLGRQIARAHRARPQTEERRLRRGHSTWLRIVAACGVAAWGLLGLGRYTAANLGDRANAATFVTRALDLLSGVSPVVPVLVLGLVVTLWAIVELVRSHGPRPALADPIVAPLLGQAVHGAVDELQEPWARLAWGMLDVPRWLQWVAAAAIAATCLFAFDPFVEPLVTAEGVWFGQFVSTAMLLAQALIVLALLQMVYLWARLEKLLGRLAWHDGAAAYDRISRDLFPARLITRVPRFMELQLLVSQWRRCVREAGWDRASTGCVPAECLAPSPAFEEEMNDAAERPWSTSNSWRTIVSGVAHGLATLRGEWRPDADVREPHGVLVMPVRPSSVGAVALKPLSDQLPLEQAVVMPVVLRAHEDLVAMAMALLIRDAVARLEHNLVFVTVAVLLVFCSHSLFPFQARQGLELVGWVYVGFTFAATLTVLARMKRNEIIGRLSSTTPGKRATWDGEFVLKMAVFGLLPILTVFATRFPDIGATILTWLEPVQKALP